MGKKKGGKKPSSAPDASEQSSSQQSTPRVQQPTTSESTVRLETEFQTLSVDPSRGGGQGRGQGRGRGRGRGSHVEYAGPAQYSPVTPGDGGYYQQGYREPQPAGQGGSGDGRGMGRGRGEGRGRGGGRGGGRGAPPFSGARAFTAGGDDGFPSLSSQGRQPREWKQQTPPPGTQQEPQGQQMPQQQRGVQPSRGGIHQSPSSSSISSVTSQGSGPPQGRQTPAHTPTPPPAQSGAAKGGGEPHQITSPPPQQQGTAEIKKPAKGSSGPPTVPIPQRKSKGDIVGRKGRPIPLQVNHLALSLRDPKMTAVHYDVAFKPDAPKRLFRLVMQAFQRAYYPNNYPAFDGRKNLYSNGFLPGGHVIQGTVKVRNEEKQEDMEFEVTVKFAARVDMSPLIQYMNRGSSTSPPQEALQAIDIVLRSPAAMRFVPVGRSFFTPPQDSRTTIDLGDGLELWYGFYQSAILGWKPFLNVDVAHKGFPKADNLIKVILDLTGIREEGLRQELDSRSKETFQKFVNGLKVEYEVPRQPQTKRTYKVNRVMGSSVRERFQYEKDGQKYDMAVGEYFEKCKGYRLQFPHMPCVHVGALQKSIYVPVELCKIAKGQALMKKLNEKQTAAMVKNAAQPADIRKKRILDAIRQANFNSDKSVKEFGISVSDRFTEITGRVLNPPDLQYSKGTVRPVKGVWRSMQFLQAQTLEKWCILNCDDRTQANTLMKFANDLSKIGSDLGCKISNRPLIIEIKKRSYMIKRDEIVVKLKECKLANCSLVAVVIPDSGDMYGKVKQAAELEVGILTQCVKAGTVFRKLNPPTVTNILLKINSKLNGVNHSIGGVTKPKVFERPVMVVGADVTHPSPDQTQIPSVAAVAASHDPKAFQYNMLWRLQPPRTEIIEDLQNIMREQLLFFNKKTNYKPEKIFFYRDGVSEGQFLEVLNKELQAIRRACASLSTEYKPKITFLVVQKRHHTRFFPTRPEDEDGRNRNVPAGTIVDTTITHPTEFDFYLVSHASIQGTSRPTKYHLLWDDNEMNEDDLEELTYYLCHLFSRCTRSVSYPAPTYYAHLAAFRARVYLDGNERLNLSKLPFEQGKRQIKDDIVLGSPMFFV